MQMSFDSEKKPTLTITKNCQNCHVTKPFTSFTAVVSCTNIMSFLTGRKAYFSVSLIHLQTQGQLQAKFHVHCGTL